MKKRKISNMEELPVRPWEMEENQAGDENGRLSDGRPPSPPVLTNVNELQHLDLRLHQFYQTSNILVSSHDPQQVWREIVIQAKEGAEAAGVRLFLIDQETGQVTDLVISEDDKVNVKSVIRSDGLSMQVVHSGQIQVVEDYGGADGRANPSFFERGIQAAIGLPVAVEGVCIGVMWVYYDHPRTFDDAEREALQLFVNQAAIAYENARKINQLEHMRQAAEALAGAADLQAVLNQIVVSACQVLLADSAVIWSYDEARLEFNPDDSVSTGIPEEVWRRSQKQWPRAGGTTDTVLQSGWLAVHDVHDLERYPFMGESTLNLLHGAGVKSFQALALQVGEEKLGALYVNYNRPKSFSRQEQEIARTFAHHAALALRNARLLAQLQMARETAAIVADVTTLANLQDTLQSVAEGVYHALRCDVVTVQVYNEEKQQLAPPPTMFGANYPERLLPVVKPNSLVLHILHQSSKFHIVEETAVDPLFQASRFTRDEGVVSCAATRLRMGAHIVGALFINYRTPHRFSENELSHIELFANQAAIAIHNAQLYERTQRRAAALEALYEAGRMITASLNLTKSLNHIAERAWALVSLPRRQINYTSIWLVQESFGTTTVAGATIVAAYPPRELAKTRQALGSSFVAWTDGEHGRTGIMHRAYRTGQAQLVENVDDDPDYLRSHVETRSELAVPIKLEEGVIGIINVEHAEYAAFDKEDIQALEALAAQAAIAIQNARLYDTAVQQARLLNLAAQVAGIANSTLDEGKLLRKIVHAIATEFGFYHVAVFLMDSTRENVVMRAASSENGQRLVRDGFKLKVGEQGLVGHVAQTGIYQVIAEVSQNRHFMRNPLLGHTQSEVTFPLIAREQIIGVLDLQHRSISALTDEQIAALETMTNQIANAIHNAQLYTQAENQRLTLQALYDAGQSVLESLDLDEILANLVEQVWKLTGTHGVQAEFSCLLLAEGNRLTFAAAYPRPVLEELRRRPAFIPLDDPQRYGVTGRAFRTGMPQLVGNVLEDPNYLIYDERIRSELAVPIRVEGHVIGVINVEHPQPQAFDESDEQALVALAAQAAIAIQNANAYTEARILQDVAASLAGELEMEELLRLVLDGAMRLMKTSSASLLFWDEKESRFEPAYTSDGPGQPLRPYQTTARRSGFTRNVVRTGRTISIYDALYVTNINPVVLAKGRRSLIGVPVLSEGKVMAVIHVYSPLPRYFSQHQVASLETLAAQAGVVIAKARQFQELKETKGLVGARTALAWMGMASNAWRHSITADSVNIRHAAELLQLDLDTAVPDDTTRTAIREKLALIRDLAARVMSRPITPPLSSEEGAGLVVVNDLIGERMNQLWADDKYAALEKPALRMAETPSVTVWVSAEWLRLALDLVIDNAIDAMRHSPVQKLMVETAVINGHIEIALHDTGPGIPPEMLPEMFKGSLKRPQREGHLGRGLLMVQAITQTYGGDLFVRESTPAGTVMVLALPVVGESGNP